MWLTFSPHQFHPQNFFFQEKTRRPFLRLFHFLHFHFLVCPIQTSLYFIFTWLFHYFVSFLMPVFNYKSQFWYWTTRSCSVPVSLWLRCACVDCLFCLAWPVGCTTVQEITSWACGLTCMQLYEYIIDLLVKYHLPNI